MDFHHFICCPYDIFFLWQIVVNEDAIKLIHDYLGFPKYFIPFTGYAKLIGAIVILIPGLLTIKEWAYAGLFFDLVAAVYASIAVAKTFDPMMLFMLVWFVPGILSYIFWKKLLQLKAVDKNPDN